LEPIYEKYKNDGFGIITIVPESRLARWKEWVESENFPWIILVEIDDELVTAKISNSSMLFRGLVSPNYLVDEKGIVIATNLSAGQLNELLMERFDPEGFKLYVENKWNLPEETTIIDKEQPINSFEELVQKLSGKPFLIDCWSSYCSPCFEEFEHSRDLRRFLDTKNMEIVYIYWDNPADETDWLTTIKEYNLQGHHLRLSDSLSKELYQMGFQGYLPVYMLVNSHGVMVEKSTFRPSEKEKLYNQIENILGENN
jgi:thiol-disulfide isomerase/thioredoxin